MSATQGSRSATAAETIPPASPLLPTEALARLGDAQLVCANAGDHGEIFELLVASGAAPSREDFLALQDNPHYEPSDRLLVRVGNRLVGHLQICRRVMQFAGLPIPVALLKSLVVLPEYQSQGFGGLMMQAADRLMQEDGSMLAMVETRTPERFNTSDWIDCGRRTFVRAGAREIRAQLAAQPVRSGKRNLSTRIWRHVELKQLTQLYRQAITNASGPLERTEDYWQWLISRQAYDQVLVAIEGSDTLDFGEQAPKIVGYAVTCEARVVEIVAQDQQEDVLRHLLVRACREAIESDHHTLRVHVPPGDAIGRMLAGPQAGRISNVDFGMEHTLVKVLDPTALVQRMFPLFQERTKAAGMDRPLDLNIQSDIGNLQLLVSRRSSKLFEENAARTDVSLNYSSLMAMLLGQVDIPAAKELGHFKTRNKGIVSVLETLFPRIRWWRPTLDDLQA